MPWMSRCMHCHVYLIQRSVQQRNCSLFCAVSTYGNTDVINAVGSVHAHNDVIKARATEQGENHPPPIPHSDDRGLTPTILMMMGGGWLFVEGCRTV